MKPLRNDLPDDEAPECIGTCMVCDPKCPVHAYRARELEQREQVEAACRILEDPPQP